MKRACFASILLFTISYGVTLQEAQQLKSKNKQQAQAAFEQLVTEEPNNAEAHYEYGIFLVELDDPSQYQKALMHLTQACTLNRNLNWQFQLACQLCRYGQLEQSIALYEKLLRQYPNQISLLYNLGFTLKCKDEHRRAIDIYKKIIQSRSDYEPAHLGLSFSHIGIGNFADGFKEHEWNLKHQKKYSPQLHSCLKNNRLQNKTILLRPEGGLGDSIHFVRYVQRLKELGAHTIVAVQPSLAALFSRCPFIDKLITLKQPMVPHHASTTLMSLAFMFPDNQNTVPCNIPYIFPDPERLVFWKKQLQNDTNFKIGICWQPSAHNDVSRLPIARRNIPLSYFYQLASTPGISVYSLQCVEGLDQLDNLPEKVTIKTFGTNFDKTHGSFMDTAAVMHSLDLIISTDTATAHLAGAMGRPVWLLLPYVTDWRWLAHRNDSPWYPTMRIFKQQAPFNWNTVIDQLHHVFFNEIFKK